MHFNALKVIWSTRWHTKSIRKICSAELKYIKKKLVRNSQKQIRIDGFSLSMVICRELTVRIARTAHSDISSHSTPGVAKILADLKYKWTGFLLLYRSEWSGPRQIHAIFYRFVVCGTSLCLFLSSFDNKSRILIEVSLGKDIRNCKIGYILP